MDKKNENQQVASSATGVPGAQTPPDAGTGAAAPAQKKWQKRMSERNPDLDLDDDDALDAYLGEQFSEADKRKEDNERVNRAIMSDPRNARLVSGILTGKNDDGEDFNLLKEIIVNYGAELKDFANTEEALAWLAEKQQQEAEEAAAEAKRKEEVANNLAKMNEIAKEVADEVGADNATMQKLVDWVYGEEDGLFRRILSRTLTKEDITSLLYAVTRDSDLERAREEGRRAGRGQRPGAAHRGFSEAPTDLGGGGSGAPETEEPEENPTMRSYDRMKPRFS